MASNVSQITRRLAIVQFHSCKERSKNGVLQVEWFNPEWCYHAEHRTGEYQYYCIKSVTLHASCSSSQHRLLLSVSCRPRWHFTEPVTWRPPAVRLHATLIHQISSNTGLSPTNIYDLATEWSIWPSDPTAWTISDDNYSNCSTETKPT